DLGMESKDGVVSVRVSGHAGESLPHSSVFATAAQASEFFETGAVGYSETRSGDRLDAVELRTKHWSVTPFDINRVESSFFSNSNLFPRGSTSFDCALMMRDMEHCWSSK